MGWVGYLLGPTLRAPYGANKKKDIIDLFKPEGDIPAVKIYRW